MFCSNMHCAGISREQKGRIPSWRLARGFLSHNRHRLGIVPLDGGAASRSDIFARCADALSVFADRVAVAGLVDADRSDAAIFLGHRITADPAQSVFHFLTDLE